MSAQRSAHRRHAIAQRGLLDGSSTSTTSDFWDWLFPPHTTSSSSTTSTSTTSSTSTTLLQQTTLPSDPFSTSLPSTTSTTSSSSTTPTPTPTLPTSTHKSTVVVTISKPATNVGANATNSTTPSGASKAGAIVGGIGATLLGIAVICALVAFFLRRWRRRRGDANAFDASSFRRSAMLMPDPPTHADTVAAGFNPRPPPLMTERTPTFGNMYGNPGPYGAQNHYLPSPSSANPFIPNHPYTQSPFSPTDPPPDPFKDLPPPVLTRNSVGTASNISGVSIDHGQAAAQYVELNRSPSFARAQYVEVPKKQQAEQPVSQDESEEDIPPPVPQKDTSATPRTSIASQSEELTDDLDFPAPPSPALTTSSKYGVSITPPVLPEISLRNSGYSFPSPAIVSQFPSGVPSLVASGQTITMTNSALSFPVTPSPMASSFTLSPGAAQKDFSAESKLTVPPPAQPAPFKRPETIYDMDDAYGGI